MSESSDDSGDVSEGAKYPPYADVEGRGSQGEGGVIEVQPPPYPKNQAEGLLMRSGWTISKRTFAWFLDGDDSTAIYSRQDCDDLIALLVELRERLP